MLKKIYHKADSGQALTEFIIMLPVFISILLAIIWHSRMIITKLQLISAARYGTDMIRHLNFDENQVRNEITDFLSKKAFRKLDSDNLNINVKVYNSDVAGLFHPQCSFVELKYTFDLPDWLGGKTVISARSEVLNGTSAVPYYTDHS